MKREIYGKISLGTINQGTVFNNGIATEYSKSSDTFGVIITPRCDIENEKVTYFHYLPVVFFDDWLKVDFWELFMKNISKQLKGKLKNILKRHKKSSSILDDTSLDFLCKKIKHIIGKEKDVKDFLSTVQELKVIQENLNHYPEKKIFEYMIEKYNKIAKNLFQELKNNKRKEFYLLEKWGTSSGEYCVVLLREIRRVSYDIGKRIGTGFRLSEIGKLEAIRNDIAYTNENEFIKVLGLINSPYIEHIIQQFSLNFTRIGVTNHSSEFELNQLNKIKK